jgi:hypothetical protein
VVLHRQRQGVIDFSYLPPHQLYLLQVLLHQQLVLRVQLSRQRFPFSCYCYSFLRNMPRASLANTATSVSPSAIYCSITHPLTPNGSLATDW